MTVTSKTSMKRHKKKNLKRITETVSHDTKVLEHLYLNIVHCYLQWVYFFLQHFYLEREVKNKKAS